MNRNQALPAGPLLLYSVVVTLFLFWLLPVEASGQMPITDQAQKVLDFKYIPKLKWVFRTNAERTISGG